MVPASEEGNGVSVDRQPQVCALGNVEALGEIAQHARQVVRAVALQQEMPAPAVLDALDGARRWPDDRDGRSDFPNQRMKPGRTARREARRRVFGRAAEPDVRDSYVRRVGRLDAAVELFAHE